MPAKFKESARVMVDRKNKITKVVHYYLKCTPSRDLIAALENSNTRPKHKQKFRNELARRGIKVA